MCIRDRLRTVRVCVVSVQFSLLIDKFAAPQTCNTSRFQTGFTPYPRKYHSYYTPNSKFGKRAANANRAGRAQRPGVLMPRRWRPGRPILIVDDVISALRNRHVTNRTPLRTSGECKGHTWDFGGTCPQSPKSLKLGTRRHYPCPRAVSTAREYGRHFWHPCPRVSKMAPVFTGRVGHQWLTQVLTRTVFRGSPKWRPSSRAVDTDREHRCHFLTLVFTGRVGHLWLINNAFCQHHPCSRAVDTDREHRCHFLTPVSTGRGHG